MPEENRRAIYFPVRGSTLQAYRDSLFSEISAVPVNAMPTVTNGGMSALGENSGTTPGQGYIEVIFGRGTFLEVIRMTGPGTQYDALKSLAATAYSKSG